MKRVIPTILAAAIGLWLSLAPAAHADMLADIKAAGKIRVAVAIGVPLFAYLDDSLKPTGSDIETARLIAEDLGVELELLEITNAARVPTIQTRKADILVANLTITPQRLEVVDFSRPYATLDIIVAGPKGSNIKSYADLAGKRIGVTRATTNDTIITREAPNAEIVRFEDDATLITAVASGQVDYVSTQSAVFVAMNEKRPGSELEVSFVIQELNLGITLPQGEEAMKAWLDEWIEINYNNGELNAIFSKFHKRDLPADLLTRDPVSVL